MLTRALIVVLVLLNISVALWWALRVEPALPELAPPTGVATLQLLDTASPPADTIAPGATGPEPTAVASVERGDARLPDAPAASDAPAALVDATIASEPQAAPASAPAPAPQRCVALGPFADQAAAATAQARLGSALGRMRVVEERQAAGASTRYRVLLPPAASREAAQETVQRIVAAGLNDYYIIAQGPEANAIALGQYRNREGAERRIAALKAAGFQPRLQGGEAAGTWWLQGALVAGQAANAVRQRSGAAQQRSLDCVRLR